MNNLLNIQVQIEKLQKQANEIKSKEFDSTVQDIVALMRVFGITVKDLQTALSRSDSAKQKKAAGAKRVAVKAKSTKATTVAPKFRGPNGEVWSGRGLTPRWLAGLVADGRQKEEFAIKS
jgi:DNA-binding protein H-NS